MPDRELPEATFTKAHVRDFQEHVIWQEIVATLEERIEVHRRELEIVSFADTNEVSKLQGAIMEIKYFLILPDRMLEEPELITEEDKGE